MTRKASECGTIAAFSQHKRRGEDPCRACKDARNAYQAEYLKTYNNSAAKDRMRLSAAARSRALRRLGQEYPQRFDELFKEERGDD